MKKVIKEIYWKLPYELRKSLFKVKYPVKYQLLKSLRTEMPEKLNFPTFKPFIENKCIFIHIPKSAGTSVNQSIFGHNTGNHATIAEYQIAFSRIEFESFFKFTFVRNPWDRLLSAFIYLKNGGKCKRDYQWAEKHLLPYKNFNDFVMKWVSKRNIIKGIHFLPQYRFLTTPKSLKPEVNFIGFFENINNDYEYIRKLLHIGKKLILENKTAEKAGDYRSYYNDKTVKIVSDVYAEDIELLGYDFENTFLEKQLASRFN